MRVHIPTSHPVFVARSDLAALFLLWRVRSSSSAGVRRRSRSSSRRFRRRFLTLIPEGANDDVTAYILQLNGAKAGTTPLARNTNATVRFVTGASEGRK